VAAIASFATLTYGFGALAALTGTMAVAMFVHRPPVSSVPQPKTER
jgi:hypothetical protein